MTPEEKALIGKAEEALGAARVLTAQGYHNSAVSEAYYAMFHAARALLLTKDILRSKHHAVIAAFGEKFAKPGLMPVETHRWLITAERARISADYDPDAVTTPAEAEQNIEHAEKFLAQAKAEIDKGVETRE